MADDVTAADDPSGYGMHVEPTPAPTYPPGCTHPTWTGDRCAGCGIGRRAASPAAADLTPAAVRAAMTAWTFGPVPSPAFGDVILGDAADFPVIVAPPEPGR